MENTKKTTGGSGGILAVILGLALILGFTVEAATCPRCKGHEVLYAVATLHECPTCGGKGKATVAQVVGYQLGR